MARQEIHSDKLPPIQQRPPLTEGGTLGGDFVTGEIIHASADGDYLADLAFMDEPVTIRLEPSADRNAATVFPVWVNGKKAEILWNDRWIEMGYLPVGQAITVKRSVLEVIIRAKVDTIETNIQNADGDRPNNVARRFTTPLIGFSILEDRNSRGLAWMAELRRRNL